MVMLLLDKLPLLHLIRTKRTDPSCVESGGSKDAKCQFSCSKVICCFSCQQDNSNNKARPQIYNIRYTRSIIPFFVGNL